MIANNKKFLIEKTNEKITSKSGLIFIVKAFKEFGILEEINKRFPKGSNSAYDPAIPVLAFILTIVGGGNKIEDINVVREDVALLKLLGISKCPSPDTIIGFMKNKESIKKLNKVMDVFRIEVVKRTNINNFTYDIDATLLESEKECADYNYKGFRSTQALLGFISEIDFCITDEYREGSVHAGVNIDKQLIKTLAIMKICNKKIDYIRSDSAAHNHKIFNICERHNIKYLIAIKNNKAIQEIIDNIPSNKWTPIFDKYSEYTEVDYAEAIYLVEGAKKATRIIIKRDHKVSGALKLYDEYYVIGTNDWDSDILDLISKYNKRGNAENYNKECKSGLNIGYTPFNELEANSIYFKIGLLAFNLLSVLKHFILKGEWVKSTVKTLRWKLFFIAGKVMFRSRQWHLKLAGISNESLSCFKEVFCQT